MTQSVQFTVYGTPAPAGSKKAFALKKGGAYTGRVGVTHDSKRSKPWMESVAREAATAMQGRELLQGPLLLTLTFCRARPSGHFGRRGLLPSAPAYPTTKPDLTKYVRAAEDALRGIVWRDDAQVCMQETAKVYAEPERVEITVQKLSQVKPERAGTQLSTLV